MRNDSSVGVRTAAATGLGRLAGDLLRDTKADVTFQPGQGITGIQLTVTAVVPGIDQDAFSAAIAAAEKNCPVSRALTGTTIKVEASLAE